MLQTTDSEVLRNTLLLEIIVNIIKNKTLDTMSKSIVSRAKKHSKKVNKGVWRMPWLLEAKKDVISCDKLGGLANTN